MRPNIHRVLKNCANLFFAPCLSNMIVPKETLNETVPKLPTLHKVCACTIPWEI